MKTFATHKTIDGVRYCGEDIVAEDWVDATIIAHQKDLLLMGLFQIYFMIIVLVAGVLIMILEWGKIGRVIWGLRYRGDHLQKSSI